MKDIPEYAYMELLQAECIIMQRRKIPRCLICKTDFVKESEYTWKPNCPCISPGLRLSMG